MKRTILIFSIALGAFVVSTNKIHAQDNTVMVGGQKMFPKMDIVDNAVNSKNHTTLVAAVKAAGLIIRQSQSRRAPWMYSIISPSWLDCRQSRSIPSSRARLFIESFIWSKVTDPYMATSRSPRRLRFGPWMTKTLISHLRSSPQWSF